MKRNVWKSVVCVLMMVALLATAVPASAASVARILKVNGDYVRMRTSANEGSATICRLRKGTKVLYWGVKNDSMCKVLTSDGKTGYVYSEYLTTYGAMPLNKVYVTTETAKTYKRSGNSLKKSGTLSKGKYVMVVKASGNWVYAKTMSGKNVYMQKSSLKKAF